ncbi:MAG: response regulator [Desulfobulbus sp.]|nr:response regulator [Desulfobulbus sp.]
MQRLFDSMDGKILIIEDDRPGAGADAAHAPVATGMHRLSVYQRGHQGLAAATSDSVDVILTTINLPDLNGFELCREFSARCPEIPMVFMAAFVSMEAAMNTIGAGAYNFITKPFDAALFELVPARAITTTAGFRKVSSNSARPWNGPARSTN